MPAPPVGTLQQLPNGAALITVPAQGANDIERQFVARLDPNWNGKGTVQAQHEAKGRVYENHTSSLRGRDAAYVTAEALAHADRAFAANPNAIQGRSLRNAMAATRSHFANQEAVEFTLTKGIHQTGDGYYPQTQLGHTQFKLGNTTLHADVNQLSHPDDKTRFQYVGHSVSTLEANGATPHAPPQPKPARVVHDPQNKADWNNLAGSRRGSLSRFPE